MPASATSPQPSPSNAALKAAKVSLDDAISRAACWFFANWSSISLLSTSFRPPTPPSELRYAKYDVMPWSKHSSTHVPVGLPEIVPKDAKRISLSVTPGDEFGVADAPVVVELLAAVVVDVVSLDL